MGTWGALGHHTLGAGAGRASVQDPAELDQVGTAGGGPARAQPERRPRTQKGTKREAGRSCSQDGGPATQRLLGQGRGLASSCGRARLTLWGCLCPPSPRSLAPRALTSNLGTSARLSRPMAAGAACSKGCCPQGPGSEIVHHSPAPHLTILMLTHEDIPSPTLLVWFSQRVPFKRRGC